MAEDRAFRTKAEVREGPNGPMIVGYGAVFNRDSEDMGFIEQVDPGAFAKTLTESDVRGLGNHDPNWLLGRSKSGSLRLSTDDYGLRYEIDVNMADPDGQRARAKVERGDWDASSFSFTTVRDSWDWQATPPQRRLLEVKLIDVGPVTWPAYPDATAASRALEKVARQVGQPVEVLVGALATGEIRSLVEPGGSDMPEPTPAAEISIAEAREIVMADPVAEDRAGAKFSAASMEQMRAICATQQRALNAHQEAMDAHMQAMGQMRALMGDGDEGPNDTNPMNDIAYGMTPDEPPSYARAQALAEAVMRSRDRHAFEMEMTA